MKYTWVTIHTDREYKGSVLDAFDFSDYILERILYELERRNQVTFTPGGAKAWIAGHGNTQTGNSSGQRKLCKKYANDLKLEIATQSVTEDERKQLSDIEHRALNGELSTNDKSTYSALVQKAASHYKIAINKAKSAFSYYKSVGYGDDFIKNVQEFVGPYLDDLDAISFDKFVNSL